MSWVFGNRRLRLAVDLKQGELRALKQQDHRRSVTHDLAANLGANGATRSCDHDGFCVEEGGDSPLIERDRVPAEQIRQRHLSDLVDGDLTLRQVGDPRQSLEPDAEVAAELEQLEPQAVRRRWDAKDGALDLLGLGVEPPRNRWSRAPARPKSPVLLDRVVVE